MIKRFRQLFGRDKPAKPAFSETPSLRHRDTPPEDGPATLHLDLDKAFYGLLLGVHSFLDIEPNTMERQVTSELQGMIDSRRELAAMIPRLPDVLPLVLQSLRDDSISGRQVAASIENDPALVGEVIRLANSPYYRTGKRITSLEQAVFMIGRQGLNELVTSASLKAVFDIEGHHYNALFGKRVWKQATLCAQTCRCFSRSEPCEPFEAFLAGLSHNLGLVVGSQVLARAHSSTEAPRSLGFRKRFVSQCQTISHLIAREWSFPEATLMALEEQGMEQDDNDLSAIGALLRWSTKMSQIQVLRMEQRVDTTPEAVTAWIGSRSEKRCLRCAQELMQ